MQNEDRRPLYAKIAIARKQLPEMDDDTFFYRDIVTENFGSDDEPIESLKALSYKQLCRLVDILGRMGAVYTSGGKNKKSRPHVRPDFIEIPEGAKHAGLKRQICAIWKKLGYSMTSIETRIERQFGIPSFLWLHDKEKLSALLSDLQKRERTFDKKKKAGGVSEKHA